MSEFGHYDLDSQGQLCYRPATPPFPEMPEIWTDYVAALKAVEAFDREIQGFQMPAVIGKLFARLDAVFSSGAEGATTTFTDLVGYEANAIQPPDTEDARSVLDCAMAFDSLSGSLNASIAQPLMAAGMLHQRLFENHPDPHMRASAGRVKTMRNATFDSDTGRHFYYTAPAALPQALAEWTSLTAGGQGSHQPELVRQALSHWMFEHIHPFTDGNGRVGRLLVPLTIEATSTTMTACAFLGEAVHANKDVYISALKHGRLSGDFAPWVRVFLAMIRQTADANLARLSDLRQVRRDWGERLKRFRRGAGAHALAKFILLNPVFTAADAICAVGATRQTAYAALDGLMDVGISRQIGAGSRNRVFEATAVMDIFEPLRRPRSELLSITADRSSPAQSARNPAGENR